jgi:hypothetical protein
VVTLSESRKPDEEMAQKYADYVTALDKLRMSSAVRTKDLLSHPRLAADGILPVETHLIEQLSTLNTIGWQVADDIETYRAAHKELDQLYADFIKGTTKARLALIVWSRAHQKMALGRTDPAKWFDITAAPGTLLGAGSKVLLR